MVMSLAATPINDSPSRSVFWVRSGLIAVQVWPRSGDLNTLLAPTYSVSGLCADSTIGVFQFHRSGGSPLGRHRADRLALVGQPIDADDVAVLGFGVDGARRPWVHLRLEAVAALDRAPVVVADAGSAAHRARPAPGVVVLQAAADVIRRLHVVGHVVELAEVHVGDGFPRAPLS